MTSNLRDWLRRNYEIRYMDEENGALGVRRKAPVALQAFGGGQTAEGAFAPLSTQIKAILGLMRQEGVPGTKHGVVQAAHSIGFDQEKKRTQDRRLQRQERLNR
jgi:hypothetical protein